MQVQMNVYSNTQLLNECLLLVLHAVCLVIYDVLCCPLELTPEI